MWEQRASETMRESDSSCDGERFLIANERAKRGAARDILRIGASAYKPAERGLAQPSAALSYLPLPAGAAALAACCTSMIFLRCAASFSCASLIARSERSLQRSERRRASRGRRVRR